MSVMFDLCLYFFFVFVFCPDVYVTDTTYVCYARHTSCMLDKRASKNKKCHKWHDTSQSYMTRIAPCRHTSCIFFNDNVTGSAY